MGPCRCPQRPRVRDVSEWNTRPLANGRAAGDVPDGLSWTAVTVTSELVPVQRLPRALVTARHPATAKDHEDTWGGSRDLCRSHCDGPAGGKGRAGEAAARLGQQQQDRATRHAIRKLTEGRHHRSWTFLGDKSRVGGMSLGPAVDFDSASSNDGGQSPSKPARRQTKQGRARIPPPAAAAG